MENLEEEIGKKEKKGRKGWWDGECREWKRIVRRELRKWKGRGESGERYRKAKKEYRRLCEEKKEEKNERWMAELRTEQV